MQIMIGARATALKVATEFKATHVIRIGQNLSGRKKFFFLPKQAVLLLPLESTNIKVELIEQLIEFVEKLPADARLFIHCASGMTRSASAAIIAACAVDRATEPSVHYKRMLQINPRIVPQKNMLAIADSLLGLQGRLQRYSEQDRSERLSNLKPLEVAANHHHEINNRRTRVPFYLRFYLRLKFALIK
ncbi:hypothetical protein KFE96_10380 [Kordiimonas sp. SCSIO 12603]|uniref:hypothetical protein n=1 Tax=Kordiimonas sp. SCSIO 12603 TaxID=2829596 RepID=UPI0021028617|nr:hypothetical protein [Kordiimonas sp. SCSIO 12603]UTW57265.1 hypothetical protein KFE96_10380 [Kordiimonas sp. SCSIO 12603]